MRHKRAKKIIGKIADRFDISMSEAKQFYTDRKKANLEGRDLPFRKWKKRNLNFDDTIEGNDIEMGDFDNFFGRKRRKKIGRAVRSVQKSAGRTGREKDGVVGLMGKPKELAKKRVRKIRQNKRLLRSLASPRFLANPRNARKVRARVKKMAQQVAAMEKRNIRRAVSRARRPDFGFDGGYYGDFSNATGNEKQSFFQKNKFLLIAGGLAFLFLTPMGKKLISK